MPAPSLPADPRRAEYAARFNRVVDHIQAHLPEAMDLETLAGVACFSPYHFHRLFHGWMGETIHDFIFRLRVERAAAQLAYSPRKSIAEVALDCGFSSSSTFARAFKAFHGVSASEWRSRRNLVETGGGNRLPAPAGESRLFRGRVYAMPLKVEVQCLTPMEVAYLRHVGPFQENAVLFERLLGRIRDWARPRGLLVPSAKLLSISHDAPEITEARNLRLDAAITVPEGTRAGGEISRQKLEGGAYAVCPVRIRPNQFIETWDTLMGGWLPGSGYQPDDRPRFEIYLNDPLTDPEGLIEVELCLAVKLL
jgi:AraC family transcriptional regulator